MGHTTIGFSREDDTATAKNELRIANVYAIGRDHFRAMRSANWRAPSML